MSSLGHEKITQVRFGLRKAWLISTPNFGSHIAIFNFIMLLVVLVSLMKNDFLSMGIPMDKTIFEIIPNNLIFSSSPTTTVKQPYGVSGEAEKDGGGGF